MHDRARRYLASVSAAVHSSVLATQLACRAPQFLARGVKVIGISADALQEHYEWIDDIIEIGNKTAPTCVEYPIVRPPSALPPYDPR